MAVEKTKDVLETVRTKRAVREFSDQPVPDEIVSTILDAGRRSQSSKNTQPWTFILIRNRETLKKLSECGTYAKHLAGADFAVALIASPDAGAPDFDLGQAAAYIQLAAWGFNVGSCIASMWEPDKAKAILGVPPDHKFDVAISFGYPAKPPAPPKQGGRRSLNETVRKEHW